MYLVSVFLLMFVLPTASVGIEHYASAAPLVPLIGKWFVFWGVGVRLMLAGTRQVLQPEFTAHQIFDLKGSEALPLVRELGVANFASGVVGVASLWMPGFVLPAAISAAIFYGVAGVRHVAAPHRSRNEAVAMVSDLFISVVLVVYILCILIWPV